MRIRKYDFNWGRRELMKKAAVGASAGLLMPLSKVLADGKDLSKAYPDELLSIDMYTKGKIKTGDYITADNVDVVKDLVDPIVYEQIKTMGRKIRIKPSVTQPDQWFPQDYYEKTVKNQKDGVVAAFDSNGNLVTKSTGGPWVGGMPFPDAKTAIEEQFNMAVSWGRHDYSQYAIKERDIGPDGKVSFEYDFVWAELQVTGRVDGTVFHNEKDKLRYQTVFFTGSQDVAGTSFMNTWYSDQRKFPALIGYLPQFRRTRTFPASQRFEPLIPGVTWFLSDVWGAGDPVLTWGDYKVVHRGPFLSAGSTRWNGDRPNWEPGVHGGKANQTFLDTDFELIPEMVVIDEKPTSYPRSPVGVRRLWVDTRTHTFISNIRYDRNGKIWVDWEAGFGRFKTPDGKHEVKDPDGSTLWSWMYVQCYDIQRNRMSRIMHIPKSFGGYENAYNMNNEEMYRKWFTQEAIQRLGTV